MPSTPLICCSSGIVTADSTTFALAPTSLLVTVTCGGARFGYSEIGSVGIETAPARMISKAQTVAKMGRRMKKSTKWDLPCSCAPLSGVRAFRTRWWLADRFDRNAVDQELNSRNNHLISSIQTAIDCIIVSDCVAEDHRSLLGHGSVI